MSKEFDELAKQTAQSVTRRGALRKFGIGIAGITLALLGLAHRADASQMNRHCNCKKYTCNCSAPYAGCRFDDFCCLQCCGPFCG